MSLPFGLMRPRALSVRWREHARQWRIYGVADRADACEVLADYWLLGWRMILPWHQAKARAAMKYLETHEAQS